MTEIQSTITYGAYDSEDILGAGNSTTEKMIADKMAEIYFSSVDADDPPVSHVEMFLGREQKYKFFLRKVIKVLRLFPRRFTD